MNCIIVFSTVLFALLVDSAPAPPTTTTTTQSIASRKDNNEVQREVQFESFFKQINEEKFEETATQMKEILKAQDELFKEFMNLGLDSGSTGSDGDSQNSRKRRSSKNNRMDTMIRNSSKIRLSLIHI